MRWYTVIPVTDRYVVRAVDALKWQLPFADSMPPHITLRHLANIEEEDVAPLTKAIKEVVNRWDSLPLELGGIGTFGQGVTFMNLAFVSPYALYTLQTEIDLAIRDLGHLKAEHRFIPHITLAYDSTYAEYIPDPIPYRFSGDEVGIHVARDGEGYTEPIEIISFKDRITWGYGKDD